MTTKKLIEELLSLPVEERAFIADSLLRSLIAPDAAISAKWLETAKRRHEEVRTGKVNPIPDEEVFSEITERFSR